MNRRFWRGLAGCSLVAAVPLLIAYTQILAYYRGSGIVVDASLGVTGIRTPAHEWLFLLVQAIGTLALLGGAYRHIPQSWRWSSVLIASALLSVAVCVGALVYDWNQAVQHLPPSPFVALSESTLSYALAVMGWLYVIYFAMASGHEEHGNEKGSCDRSVGALSVP